jgi:hypothetical protein
MSKAKLEYIGLEVCHMQVCKLTFTFVNILMWKSIELKCVKHNQNL